MDRGESLRNLKPACRSGRVAPTRHAFMMFEANGDATSRVAATRYMCIAL